MSQERQRLVQLLSAKAQRRHQGDVRLGPIEIGVTEGPSQDVNLYPDTSPDQHRNANLEPSHPRTVTALPPARTPPDGPAVPLP